MPLVRSTQPIKDSDIPDAIARDVEFNAADAQHVASPNPHFQYLLLSESVKFLTKASTHNSAGNIDDLPTGFASLDANLGDGVKGWHFLTLLRAGNETFGVQFAACDTQKSLRYRPKIAGAWQSWAIII
jgi:hypothetical protein